MEDNNNQNQNNQNNQNNEEKTQTSPIAVGKKLNLSLVDKKVMEGILSNAGKEPRQSPFSGSSSPSSHKRADPVKLELVDLPLEEKNIQETLLESALNKYLLDKSLVTVGDRAFVADRLTGVPCPHYFLTIPSVAAIEAIGATINGSPKGRAKKLHSIAGKFSQYHGAFASTENLFTFLHCVMGISVSSVIFRDILKIYHCEEASFTSKRLNDHYTSILKSKVFGGNNSPSIPAQGARLSKSLKCPGCFFYAGDDESPFGHSPIKHSHLRTLYRVPSQVTFPFYEDWSIAVAKVKAKRESTTQNTQKWKEFVEKYGKEAALQLFEELKQRKKQKRDAGGIVELESGEVVLKKPRLVVDEDEDDEENMDISVLFDGGDSPSSSSVVRDTIQIIEDSSVDEKLLLDEKLIHSFVDSLSKELHDPFGPDPSSADWGDECRYSDVIDFIEWEGVDFIDDSSQHYKNKIKKIHRILQKKE